MKVYRRPIVQALLPGDIDKRVKWAEDYLEAAERDFTYPDNILWTDEAIFHLDGHVKRHDAVISTTAEGVASPASYHGGEEEFVVYQHDGASAHYETHVRAWLGWRTDGWAEGDPYNGQHEVLIYLHWTSGFGVT
ncbi:hypothetical protein EMCRGX_G013548 [Ephydatia muelleri]